MKEATGEVSMTVVTLVAIAVIGAILATQWDSIKNKINNISYIVNNVNYTTNITV